MLLVARATAEANGRDLVEPRDLPITKGLQESIHGFEGSTADRRSSGSSRGWSQGAHSEGVRSPLRRALRAEAPPRRGPRGPSGTCESRSGRSQGAGACHPAFRPRDDAGGMSLQRPVHRPTAKASRVSPDAKNRLRRARKVRWKCMLVTWRSRSPMNGRRIRRKLTALPASFGSGS
jgi:hypothetical protein